MRNFYFPFNKRFFLILVFTLFLRNSFAQYQPLVVDSALWIEGIDDPGTPWIPDSYYANYILGDTTINSILYKKVYEIGIKNEAPNWPMPLKSTGMSLIGFMRENAKQVFAILFFNAGYGFCPINTEFLLYDFNYSVGDTIAMCSWMNYPNPDTISSITNNGNIKTFIINTMFPFSEYTGSQQGLFQGIGLQISGTTSSVSSHCIGDLLSCNISTGISNAIGYDKIEVFPNPATNNITIKNLPPFNNCKLQLIDEFGRIVYELKLNNSNSLTINPTISAGYYTIAIVDNDNYLFRNKLLFLNPH